MVPLPESYSDVPPTAPGIKQLKVPIAVGTVRPNGHTIIGEMLKERNGLRM